MTNYELFYQLHHRETPLLLANAWNVKSAQLIEQNGFQAIGTSSGAISNSLGYEDGEKMPFSELVFIVKRIKASTTIPLTVDLERGYTDDPSELTGHVDRLIELGVAGINLEDTQGEELYVRKLHAIRDHLEKSNQKLFINARTDGFRLKVESLLETTLRRAKRYQDAGADGLFVTAVTDPATIKELASATRIPLNVVGTPQLSSIKALAECGVRRISMAVFLYQATYRHSATILKEVVARQSFDPLF